MADASELPAALLRDFHRVDDPFQVERYNAALAEIGAGPTARKSFHVDAAGFSPELAGERGDPLYLCAGALRAHALIVALEQLRAPLVHPGLGFAAEAYLGVCREARQEIGRITLREPLIAEVSDPATRLAEAVHLADVSHVEIRFRTPGGLLQGLQRLEALKEEFLESDRRWLDDEFIGELCELAAAVRDLGVLSHDFATSKHALGPFYAAAFGGSYVLEEPGESVRAATTSVLCSEPAQAGRERRSARGRLVSIEPLDARAAAALLERHALARPDLEVLRREPEILDEIAHWIAADQLLSRDPEARLEPGRAVAQMLAAGDPPEAWLELCEVGRQIRGGRGHLDPDAWSPLLRARLLAPCSRREPIRRFARHLRAFVDPVHLGRSWRDAPDVFFTRLPALSAAQSAYFARWLEAQQGR